MRIHIKVDVDGFVTNIEKHGEHKFVVDNVVKDEHKRFDKLADAVQCAFDLGVEWHATQLSKEQDNIISRWSELNKLRGV